VTYKNGENYILVSFVLFSDYYLGSYYDVPGKWFSEWKLNVHTVLVRYVSILESSNFDDKTWKENNIKLALGKTVVKFMGLKLPRGSMQALVRSFRPLDSSSSRKSANLPQFHS